MKGRVAWALLRASGRTIDCVHSRVVLVAAALYHIALSQNTSMVPTAWARVRNTLTAARMLIASSWVMWWQLEMLAG